MFDIENFLSLAGYEENRKYRRKNNKEAKVLMKNYMNYLI